MALEPSRPVLGRRLAGESLVDLLHAPDLEVLERLVDGAEEGQVAVASEKRQAVAAVQVLDRMRREEHGRARVR